MKSQVNVPNEWEKTGFCCCVVYPKRKAPLESLCWEKSHFCCPNNRKRSYFVIWLFMKTLVFTFTYHLCRSDTQVSQMPSLISKPPWILRYLGFPPGRVTRYGIRPISTDWSAIIYDRFKKLFKGNNYKSFATRWIKALQQRGKANLVSGKWYSFSCN